MTSIIIQNDGECFVILIYFVILYINNTQCFNYTEKSIKTVYSIHSIFKIKD